MQVKISGGSGAGYYCFEATSTYDPTLGAIEAIMNGLNKMEERAIRAGLEHARLDYEKLRLSNAANKK